MKALISIAKILGQSIYRIQTRIASEYIRARHGPRADICFITGADKDMLSFSTSHTYGQQRTIKSVGMVIRRQVAENILLVHGINHKEPFRIFLVLAPSAIKKLGITKTINFLKEWPGVSKVSNLPAIEYYILGRTPNGGRGIE